MSNFCGLSSVLVFFLFLTAAAYSQTGISLNAEINNIERQIARQDITAAERHGALVSLARLRQLSGDIEGAAKNWLEAAAEADGRVDDDALLNCAYCLAAMGEWDRASIALEPLLLRYKRARFLYITINAVKTGDLNDLSSIADSPEYSDIKAEVLFILWRLSGSASWRQRLTSEFPASPEGRLAAGSGQSVVINPTAFWLFMSSADTLSQAGNAAVLQSPPREPAGLLQAGIFSQQENARNLAASLRQAGFTAAIEQRQGMWAVTVPAGHDPSRAITELRAAGFETFLIK